MTFHTFGSFHCEGNYCERAKISDNKLLKGNPRFAFATDYAMGNFCVIVLFWLGFFFRTKQVPVTKYKETNVRKRQSKHNSESPEGEADRLQGAAAGLRICCFYIFFLRHITSNLCLRKQGEREEKGLRDVVLMHRDQRGGLGHI